jgi:hypothetical protein
VGRRTAAAVALVLGACAGCARGAYVRPGDGALVRAAPPDAVPAGTLAAAQVQQPLSTATSRPGDRFTASLLDPLVDGSGREVVARGAVLEGLVVRTDASSRAGDPGGFELSLLGVRSPGEGLVALPLEVARAPVALESRWRRGVFGALGGAAAGAGAGLAIDREQSGAVLSATLVGAGLGALAAALLGKREAELPSGSVLTLRVREDLRAPALAPEARGATDAARPCAR